MTSTSFACASAGARARPAVSLAALSGPSEAWLRSTPSTVKVFVVKLELKLPLSAFGRNYLCGRVAAGDGLYQVATE